MISCNSMSFKRVAYEGISGLPLLLAFASSSVSPRFPRPLAVSPLKPCLPGACRSQGAAIGPIGLQRNLASLRLFQGSSCGVGSLYEGSWRYVSQMPFFRQSLSLLTFLNLDWDPGRSPQSSRFRSRATSLRIVGALEKLQKQTAFGGDGNTTL